MFPTTVQFGTRLAAAPDNDNDEHDYENLPAIYDDKCSNVIQCDAVKDCTLGSDETVCGEQAHATRVFAGFRISTGIMWLTTTVPSPQ